MKLDMEGGLGLRQIVLNGDPAPLPPKNRPCLLLSNGWMDQDAAWYRGRLSPGHTVLDGDPAPLPKGAQPANFRPMPIAAKWLDGSRCQGREVGLGPGHIVLDGDPPPLPQRVKAPQFSVHVYCGQTVAHLSYC